MFFFQYLPIAIQYGIWIWIGIQLVQNSTAFFLHTVAIVFSILQRQLWIMAMDTVKIIIIYRPIPQYPIPNTHTHHHQTWKPMLSSSNDVYRGYMTILMAMIIPDQCNIMDTTCARIITSLYAGFFLFSFLPIFSLVNVFCLKTDSRA